MSVPHNIMQIGTPDNFYRVYIEDYVFTYIKQLEKESDIERKKVYLFGRKENSQEEIALYIYGAADSDKGILSIQHEFFSDHSILGIMTLSNNLKEISLQNGIAFQVNGFYVFYEQNTAMQSFLIHNFQESEKKEKIEEPQMRVTRQEWKNNRPQHDNRHTEKEYNNGNLLYMTTFIMAIVICIIAITAINQYDKMIGFNNDVLQAGNIQLDTMSKPEEKTTFYIEEVHETESMEEISSSMEAASEIMDESYQEYIVEKGDSLVLISRKFYGNDDSVKDICRLNEIENPDSISPGQKILLP